MEGYYDNTCFHRVIKDFMAQGGDPTGTGQGGESVYGKYFKDEFHSRLKFTRRGLVAMANSGKNTNAAQFFITLGKCDWLDKKHTIFGKATGTTIYNVIKFNDVVTDGNDRPESTIVVKSAEILSNPFPDIVPRKKPDRLQPKPEKKKKKKKKTVKNTSLLSFGDEEDYEPVKKKVKPKHEVEADKYASDDEDIAAKKKKKKTTVVVRKERS